MNTVEREAPNAFAVWITGLPASGKSTLTASLKTKLAERGIHVAVLESDLLRQIFTPNPRYDDDERDIFYSQMAFVGALLTQHGVPVIFDATAHLRRYRDQARRQIPRLLEVYVECPLETCIARDPKGAYLKARAKTANTVPGLRTAYEPPENPDIVVQGDQESPETAAARVIAKLAELCYLDLDVE
jgi:adenylylsulfate kinase